MPLDKVDDLILRCNTDMTALGELYRMFKSDVTALTRSIVKTKENTEDALQETFIRLRNIAKRYMPSGRGKVYILKIASNVAYEIRRKNKRFANIDDVYIESPINEFVRAEAGIVVEQLMRYLNESERELIALRYYSDLTLKEAAEVIGKPVSMVQWRLESIFAKLRNHGVDIEVD